MNGEKTHFPEVFHDLLISWDAPVGETLLTNSHYFHYFLSLTYQPNTLSCIQAGGRGSKFKATVEWNKPRKDE